MPAPPPSAQTITEKQRAMHREQVERVRESLRAGVVYVRPGRVAKHVKQR